MDYSPEGGGWLGTSSGDSNAENLDCIQILSLCGECKPSAPFLPGPTTLRLKTGAVAATRPQGGPPHPTPFHLVQARPQGCLRTEKVTVSPGPSMCSKPKAVVSCTKSAGSPAQIKTPPRGYYLKHWFKYQVSQRKFLLVPCPLGDSGTQRHTAVGLHPHESIISHALWQPPQLPPSMLWF